MKTRLLSKTYLCLAALSPAPLADAATAARAGVALKLGTASFAGDLSEDKGQIMAGALAMVYPPDGSFAKPSAPFFHDALKGLELRAMADAERTNAHGADGQRVGVTMAGVDVLACVLADLPLQVCPYAGGGAVQLTDGYEEATSPSRSYGALVPFKLDEVIGRLGVVAGGQLNFYSTTARVGGRPARMDEGTLSAFLGTSF